MKNYLKPELDIYNLQSSDVIMVSEPSPDNDNTINDGNNN